MHFHHMEVHQAMNELHISLVIFTYRESVVGTREGQLWGKKPQVPAPIPPPILPLSSSGKKLKKKYTIEKDMQ